MPAHGGQLGDGLVGSSGRWSRSHRSLGKWSRNLVGRWASDGQLAAVVPWVSEGRRSGKPEEMNLVGEERGVGMEREELLLAGEGPRQ